MLAARSGAVKARTSAINTARSLLTTAPDVSANLKITTFANVSRRMR